MALEPKYKAILFLLPFFLSTVLSNDLDVSTPQYEDAEVPPMYTTHDDVSETMQKRMTIPNGDLCNVKFEAELKQIVREMEDNQEASLEVAEEFLKKFQAIMHRYEEDQLCFRESWCVEGTCQPRPGTGILGRFMPAAESGSGRHARQDGGTQDDNSNNNNKSSTITTTTVATAPKHSDEKNGVAVAILSFCHLFLVVMLGFLSIQFK